MPKARLYFDGDNTWIEKNARTYSLTQSVEDAIDSIPWIVDNTTSTSTTDALSANMGRDLQEQINNLASRGRFLSTWDCVTGLPDTQPQTNPYVYRAWDYYVVGNVGTTNYRPHGSEYTIWIASTDVETLNVAVNDLYIYDWTQWVRQWSSHWVSVAWGTIVWNIADQTDLQTEFYEKADKINVLEKDNTTSYTPMADYHPATKKYSDDNDTYIGTSAPTNNVVEWRLWYDTANDVLKVWNWTQWNTTWWWSDIEYVTQAEYNALLPWAESDWKHYFIYTSSGQSWWQPWANTIAYFPFIDDVLDHSGNWVVLSWSWTKSTIWYTFNTSVWFTNNSIKFISTWLYVNSIWSGWWNTYDVLPASCMGYAWWNIYHVTPTLNDQIVVFVDSSYSVWWTIQWPSKQAWHHLCVGYDWTKTIVAIDWNVQTLYNWAPYNFGNSFYINHSRTTWDSTTFSETIIESECWTAQEIADYYDQTKSIYWIS